MLAALFAVAFVPPPSLHVRPAVHAVATPPVTMLAESDRANWCADVEGAEKLTVVFFYAPWCRNCKAVRPKLQRIAKKIGDEAAFYQVNFKTETELCYEQRVFNFPTVHFYLPGIGRVARAVLTASNTDAKMKAVLDRLVSGREQLQSITAAAIQPVVQYSELVGALQGLAEMAAPKEIDASGFGAGLNVKKESARLRTMVEGDERRLMELEQLFQSLDSDADGRLQLGELEAAVGALQPADSAGEAASELRARLARGGGGADDGADDELSIDQETFVSLMVDKAVHDFAAGEKALLPVFEALDANGDGTVTQQELLAVIENFCNERPDADGCDVDHRKFKLAQAFSAFADEDMLLDYGRFVEMVSGRTDAFGEECVIDVSDAAVRSAEYLDDMMGERECFGEAVTVNEETEEEEDDIACDAWFFGEDPTAVKEEKVIDVEKFERLKAEGAAQARARAQKEADMKAMMERLKKKAQA